MTASVVGSAAASFAAAANAATLSAFGSAKRSVPSAPGSPWNFCQSPVTLRIASTGSVGCAPTPSQYCTRSEFTRMSEGCCLGW